jgi:hypothetical protein
VNATARFAIRSVLAGVLVSASNLQASMLGSGLTTNEIVSAILAGIIASLTWAGIEYQTPINPNVGK